MINCPSKSRNCRAPLHPFYLILCYQNSLGALRSIPLTRPIRAGSIRAGSVDMTIQNRNAHRGSDAHVYLFVMLLRQHDDSMLKNFVTPIATPYPHRCSYRE